jgi:cytosine/adenosine deaminase-related metal-dependent hydrolase
VIVYRAAWILPICSTPIRDGWLAVDGGRVHACGAGAAPAGTQTDLGRVAILPGLVNAHTHLELSWMRGRVPRGGDGMVGWVRRMLGIRRAAGQDDPAAIAAGVAEARAAGTALVGDVTNTLAAVPALKAAGLAAVFFYELIGFNVADSWRMASEAMEAVAKLETDRVRGTIAPHAPYSVSPELFRDIAREVDMRKTVSSVHAGESREEMTFLRDGKGPWREMLLQFNSWNPKWRPPDCGPIEYLDRLGVLTGRLLVVHAVQLGASELKRVADVDATIVTCPRSNVWIGVGEPPIQRFYASGARVAIGTDSLASVGDLNLFSELASIRSIAPHVPAARLLESATRAGAEALAFGGDLGVLAPGARAEAIAVSVPDGVTDVEEYLVGGVQPTQIRWLDDRSAAL